MPVNKVILVGNLGRDPEIRYLPSGQTVANFSVATTERFKGRDGAMKDQTEWHNIVAYGKTAELCGQYLKKGRQVYIEGRLQTRQWEAKDGSGKRSRTEIVALNVQFLGGRPGAGAGPEEPTEMGAGGAEPAGPMDDEDIPF
ncbi:MAG TPA: single-stranded DNA-binding protein [Candidatus Binataceae bacterium]|nr:single-stranded DNA-binding protein [Candidatus Binataceae bacterium]